MFSFIPAVLIQIQISSGLRKDDVLQCLSICMKLRGNEAELERNRRLMKEAGSKVLRGWNAKSCLYLMCYLVVFLKKKIKNYKLFSKHICIYIWINQKLQILPIFLHTWPLLWPFACFALMPGEVLSQDDLHTGFPPILGPEHFCDPGVVYMTYLEGILNW